MVYQNSNNQKLERPPCGSTAHAVVHNAHSAHAALPGHVMCGPMQRPGCHLKKGTVRGNGDVLKRSRIQTADRTLHSVSSLETTKTSSNCSWAIVVVEQIQKPCEYFSFHVLVDPFLNGVGPGADETLPSFRKYFYLTTRDTCLLGSFLCWRSSEAPEEPT
ncbi:hypothetical protein RUM44_006318 [Polyplax serrata]|uniref:Uncharacterized protein n=1 Tax=Polyplax serrata TaxID=468196 RepID=A0ABR1AHR3_POLSC